MAQAEIVSRAPEETRGLGARLGTMLQRGDVLALVGPLGAGKTTLVQGIAEGAGCSGRVRSPSFTLVNEYSSPRGNLYHLDLFRLDSTAEAEEAGLHEFIPGDGIAVVEWAEKAGDLLPREYLEICLQMGSGEAERLITLTAHGERYCHLLAALTVRAGGGPGKRGRCGRAEGC